MNVFSFSYIVFLVFAALLYYFMPRAARSFWLLACSYVFYLYNPTNIGFVLFLVTATVITWLSGFAMQCAKSVAIRRLFLIVSIIGCLFPLLYFKYSNFFISTVNDLLSTVGIKNAFGLLDLALPLGISYYTFAALGYTIDIYLKKYTVEKNFFHYALFVGFFPCMFTGPIERADHMLEQFKKPPRFDYNTFSGGVFRILYGTFKKLVIADNIGKIISAVFKLPTAYSGGVVFAASLLFTLQLYMDFSGCSDIAIGTASLFGIKLNENFKSPLLAESFTDFWRRWHISLSSWLSDYIYIPLGGSRCKISRIMINLMITFIVSGIWHGASWGYVVWGVMNGVFLCVGRLTRPIRKKINEKNVFFTNKWLMPIRKLVLVPFTYYLFSITLVIFWSEMYAKGLKTAVDAYGIIIFQGYKLFTDFSAVCASFTALGMDRQIILVIFLGTLFCFICEAFKRPINLSFRKVPFIIRWPIYYALLICILVFGVFGQSAFIYQSF